MSVDWSQIGTDIKTVIGEIGFSITLTKYSGDVPAVTSTDTAVAGTSTAYTPNGVMKPYPDSLIDETRILSSDRMLFIDNTVEPALDDEVTVDGETWNIVSIRVHKPTTVALGYWLQLRK